MSNFLMDNIISKIHDNKKNSHEGYFHIALIPNSKSFISSTNDYNRTCLQKQFIYSLHAEASALHKFNNTFKNNPNKKIKNLIVLRMNKQGKFRCSKPCYNCTVSMLKNNVEYVIYSEDDGSMTKIKVKELINNFILY